MEFQGEIWGQRMEHFLVEGTSGCCLLLGLWSDLCANIGLVWHGVSFLNEVGSLKGEAFTQTNWDGVLGLSLNRCSSQDGPPWSHERVDQGNIKSCVSSQSGSHSATGLLAVVGSVLLFYRWGNGCPVKWGDEISVTHFWLAAEKELESSLHTSSLQCCPYLPPGYEPRTLREVLGQPPFPSNSIFSLSSADPNAWFGNIKLLSISVFYLSWLPYASFSWSIILVMYSENTYHTNKTHFV